MKTQIFKTTLIVLMVSLFGQFQVNGAIVNPYATPEYKVKFAESRVSKYKKDVQKTEGNIKRRELLIKNLENDKRGLSGTPSKLSAEKRSLQSEKERLANHKRSLRQAEEELTKARAQLAERKMERKMKENEGSPATNNQSPLTQVPQTAQANPQAPLNAPKLPFPFSSYDVWIKTGKILPGMTGLLHGENADGTFTDDRLSTIRDREAGRAYGYLTMPQNRSGIPRWVARRPNGKKLAWTFGGNQRNLLHWKGQSAKNVLSVFGKADRIVNVREQGVNGFQTTADWDYNVMNIRDSINGLHTRVRFEMNNGVVLKIRLLD